MNFLDERIIVYHHHPMTTYDPQSQTLPRLEVLQRGVYCIVLSLLHGNTFTSYRS